MANTDITTYSCLYCGSDFQRTRSGSKKYCSLKCKFMGICKTVSADTNGCFIWPKSKNIISGYGQVSSWDGVKRKMFTAHRLSYEYFVSPIPDGMFVLHKCDVRDCFNPSHLFVGDHSENMRDMYAKRRHPKSKNFGGFNFKRYPNKRAPLTSKPLR